LRNVVTKKQAILWDRARFVDFGIKCRNVVIKGFSQKIELDVLILRLQMEMSSEKYATKHHFLSKMSYLV
jgi:hypothetical protein